MTTRANKNAATSGDNQNSGSGEEDELAVCKEMISKLETQVSQLLKANLEQERSGTTSPPSSKDSLINDLRAALLRTTPITPVNNLAAEKLIMKTAEISSNFSSLS